MPYPDDSSLTAALSWLLGGGLGVLAYWCRYLLDQHTNFHAWRTDAQLLAGVGIAIALGALGGYLLTLYAAWLGIAPAPGTSPDWHQLLYTVIYKTVIASRVIDIRDSVPTDRVVLAQKRADARARDRAQRRHLA